MLSSRSEEFYKKVLAGIINNDQQHDCSLVQLT